MAASERRADQAYLVSSFGALLSVFAPSQHAAGGPGAGADILTAKSLASVGLIGLVGLPLLMLASLLLQAPLAAPAAISLGYLAAARALARGHRRRAAGWIIAVSGALVVWTLLVVAAHMDDPSRSSFAALLLAPVFAAAPAMTRRLAGKSDPGRPDLARRAVGPQSKCVTRLVPSVARSLTVEPASEPAPARAADPGPERGGGQGASVALAPVPPLAEPRSDVQDAVGFALRHSGRQAREKGISLVCSGDSTLAAHADRQTCRRILNELVGEVVSASPLGATVHILARGVKGAVLLRVSCSSPTWHAAGPASRRLGLDKVRLSVDQAGGTLIATSSADGICVSLRLARAEAVVTQGRRGQNSGAA